VNNKKQISIYKFIRITHLDNALSGRACLLLEGEKYAPVLYAVKYREFVYLRYLVSPSRSLYVRYKLSDVVRKGEDIVVFIPDETVVII
jgi:hypothetical protein